MGEFIRYWWTVFCLAFGLAWTITACVAGIFAIIGGIIVWKYPQWESTMKNLLWMTPLAIFVLLLIIRSITAPYTIHKNQERKISRLQNDLDNALKQAFATPDALISPTLQNMKIRINDLTRESFIIRNRTFDNCHIYGPAIIHIKGTTMIINNTFAEVLPDSAFIETSNKYVSGAISLEDCIVKNCTFHKISFIGNSELIAKLKAGFDLPK